MKNRIFSVLVLALVCLTAAGCATQTYGTVLPKSDGTFHLVEKGKTENAAMKMAQADAAATCRQHAKSKNFVTIDHSSEYVGIEAERGKGLFSSIAGAAVEYAARENSNENYKVEMIFKCS